MEDIQAFHPTLNRTAIIVQYKEPFINWLTSIEQENEYLEMREDLNCYLVPSYDEEDELRDYLKSQYDNIFKNELHDWYTDSSLWPENRTYEMFREWFDLTVHVTVFDLESSSLKRAETFH